MFAIGSGLFMIAQVIGILTGFLNLKLPEFSETLAVTSSVSGFIIAFVIATVALILLLKFVKGNLIFKIMLALLIFLGSEMVLSTFLPGWLGISLALVIVVLRFVYPNIFVQNFSMTLAIAGIGASIGLMVPVGAVILILIILSIYDYIAVYKTGHMVKLFKGLIDRAVPLSLIIPDKMKGFKENVNNAVPGKDNKGERKFMMLGTGDIAFPIIFAVSAVRHSVFSGVAVLFGAFFGITLIYSILLNSKKGAIPALPPIAACTITAFILSLIVEWLVVIF
jgi:presenilin-like A22 family membrane protease